MWLNADFLEKKKRGIHVKTPGSRNWLLKSNMIGIHFWIRLRGCTTMLHMAKFGTIFIFREVRQQQ